MNASSPVPRLALIGISGYGRVHLQLARESQERGEARIVAATVINPAEEAENVAQLRAAGVRIFGDHLEMLRACAGEIDLCLIPTGIHWHARMTIAALAAGANVLVEKPLAGSSEEVHAIRAAEQRSGRFVAVGFQDYYEPGTAWLQQELQRGAIGSVRSVRFLGVWPRRRSYFSRNDWAGRLQVGGVAVLDSPLNNAFAHFAMLSLFYAGAGRGGPPLPLDTVETLRAHAIESFDTCVVTAHTRDGVRLWFGASHACPETIEPEIAITGTQGEACWRYESEAWWRRPDGTGERKALLDTHGARRAMLTAALRRVSDPHVSVCTTAMAGEHTALVEAVHRQGRIVPLPAATVRWVGEEGAEAQIPEVPGLIAALRTAFRTEKTLADSGFAASRASGSPSTSPASLPSPSRTV